MTKHPICASCEHDYAHHEKLQATSYEWICHHIGEGQWDGVECYCVNYIPLRSVEESMAEFMELLNA